MPLSHSGAQILDFAITISNPVTITGSVLDYGTGTAIPGAHVQLVGSDHSQLTDSTGAFGFTGVPPGKQIIETSLLGYAPRVDSLTVFSDEALGLEIELATEPSPLTPAGGRRAEGRSDFHNPGTVFGLTKPGGIIADRVVDFAGLRVGSAPGFSIRRNFAGQEILCIERDELAQGDPTVIWSLS